MAGKRPEHQLPPDLYYNEEETAKYAKNSHIAQIQTDMAERALELLALPDEKVCYLLDLELAHMDEDDPTRDVILRDLGLGLPFRPGTFDGAVSISAIQWLCHANTTSQNPRKRLHRFFQSLYACLGRGTRAVFQFYPENQVQSELIMSQAMRAGFNGGLVVDFPNSTRAKKVYLVLMTGGMQQLPRALTEEDAGEERPGTIDNIGRRITHTNKGKPKRAVKGSREWIEAKRERAVKHGKEVQHSSKYSGRKRKPRF